ncbi:MAG TPA: cupin domain-containing protein [Chitinophagaceae bacterium]|nr:cupin domain-containing protein [Chitinophagaceae bacterium]
MSIKKYTVALGMLSFLAVSCGEADLVDSTNLPKSNDVEMDPLEYRDFGNDPFVFKIEDYTKQNETYRTALWTGEYMQLTVMNILPGEDIGLEVHNDHDQFIRVEEGEGIVLMGDTEDDLSFERKVEDDFAIMIPAGKWHNVVNNSDEPLKLYSIYAPREHPHGAVHETREEGIAAEEAAHDNH